MSSVSSILSPDNLVHNQWILDYIPDNTGWRLAAGLVFVPNILFSIMANDCVGQYTKSGDLGLLCANYVGIAPVITMATGNPIWLIPSAGFLAWAIYINLK
jgi:hypothetical protein